MDFAVTIRRVSEAGPKINKKVKDKNWKTTNCKKKTQNLFYKKIQ